MTVAVCATRNSVAQAQKSLNDRLAVHIKRDIGKFIMSASDNLSLQVSLGLERMSELMKLCNKFMLRRTSTVLKSLLPAKVEQVGNGSGCAAMPWQHICTPLTRCDHHRSMQH